jgi:cell division transport system ATP-binding protein
LGQKVSTAEHLAYHQSVLWLEGVCCQRGGLPVIDTVTFGVARSELIVVQGEAGAGKSTLLELAAGLRTPERGAVWFAGRNISTLQQASLPFVRRNIGYTTTDPLLVPEDSALDNVALALAVRGETPKRALELARDALAWVGAADLEARPVQTLSAGQKRVVALARAVAGPPSLIVADEPGAGAGDHLRATIVTVLGAARDAGAAVLTATADSALVDRLVEIGGRRIHLEQGRVAGAPAVGLVPDFMSAPAPDLTPIVLTTVRDLDTCADVSPARKGPL